MPNLKYLLEELEELGDFLRGSYALRWLIPIMVGDKAKKLSPVVPRK
jgi:hypothetical protein